MDFFKDLNFSQKQAAMTTEGAIRVVAGPGSGKTRTLTARYAYLVSTLGIPPKNILTVTFTNKAADEMKRRIRASIGDNDLAFISTIHSFCRLFLREEIHVLGYPQNFTVIDRSDQSAFLRKIYKDMGLTTKVMTYTLAIDSILEARKMSPESYIDKFLMQKTANLKSLFSLPKISVKDGIFYRYLYEQKKNFCLDFNDLINFALFILANYSEILKKWQERIIYIMVDEFQDVSLKQYKVVQYLAGLHGNIFIVGDSDQTIYSWRGSHHKIFLDFPKDYDDTETIILNENYRSTPQILQTAQTLIKENVVRFYHELIPTLPSGNPPIYFNGRNVGEEADWITDEILKLRDEDQELNKIAILCRANYQSGVIEAAFGRKSIPYHKVGSIEFYRRKEIKDSLAYLQMVSNPNDIAFERTVNNPPREIGEKTLEQIYDFAEKNDLNYYESIKEMVNIGHKIGGKVALYIRAIEKVRGLINVLSLDDLFQEIMNLSGYEENLLGEGDDERIDIYSEFKRSLAEFAKDPENTLEDFLAKMALITDLDFTHRYDGVTIMTIHAAKGLEFDNVFICGLNERVFPTSRTETPEELEEERRLCYVAITRAKKNLYLSSAEGYDKEGFFREPSRFLLETIDTITGFRDKDIAYLAEKISEKSSKLKL
ncbi:MAG: UvrD-helicase domain-containing protein, partial [Deltaproteobacteria bacterium]|nr:UvrD-helicase domain-containing protein [Deltaproteobacteria bacterium]